MGYVRFALRLWPLAVFGFVVDVAAAVVAWRVHGQVTGPPLTFLVVVVFAVNPFILPTPEMYEPRHSPLDNGLTDDLARLAAIAEVKPLPVHRLTGKFGSRHVSAHIKDEKIFVTQKAVETVSSEGVRFMLGHEVAHLIKLKEI